MKGRLPGPFLKKGAIEAIPFTGEPFVRRKLHRTSPQHGRLSASSADQSRVLMRR